MSDTSLRDLPAKWRDKEREHEEAAAKPFQSTAQEEWHNGLSQAYGEAADELESALSGLSPPALET